MCLSFFRVLIYVFSFHFACFSELSKVYRGCFGFLFGPMLGFSILSFVGSFALICFLFFFFCGDIKMGLCFSCLAKQKIFFGVVRGLARVFRVFVQFGVGFFDPFVCW